MQKLDERTGSCLILAKTVYSIIFVSLLCIKLENKDWCAYKPLFCFEDECVLGGDVNSNAPEGSGALRSIYSFST